MATLNYTIKIDGKIMERITKDFKKVGSAKSYIETFMKGISGYMIESVEKSNRNKNQVYRVRNALGMIVEYSFEITT